MPRRRIPEVNDELFFVGDVVNDNFAGGGEKQLVGHIAGQAAQTVGTAPKTSKSTRSSAIKDRMRALALRVR